jgi:hypothetical protein
MPSLQGTAPCSVEEAIQHVRESKSWAMFRVTSDVKDMAERLERCGQLRPARIGGPLIQELRPLGKSDALPRSLSSAYGQGPFPAHFDGSQAKRPPPLVVMWCLEDEQGRPTSIYDWRQVIRLLSEPERLSREVFEFRSGRRSLIDSIASPGRKFVRYDPACMFPRTRGGAALLRDLINKIEDLSPRLIQWKPGLGVVLDNWHQVHGRASSSAGGNRVLMRSWLD